MSVWKLVKLNFGRSPAHFGETGIGLEKTSERVRSDTLFSAWVSAYAKLPGSDIAGLLEQFPTSDRPALIPPFRISSTFVYNTTEDNKNIYYLPRPLKFPINYPAGEGDLEFFKTYKKLNYLPLKVWQRWYLGSGFTQSDRAELIAETKDKSSGNLREAGTFDCKKAFEINQVPKIAVDRVTRATNLYHTGFVQFRWQQNGSEIESLSGLYFLLEFPEENQQLENTLHAALILLGEEGLGGERSSGAGRFEVEWLELPEGWKNVLTISQPTHYSLISLFWELPLDGLITDDTSYEIVECGGWLSASPSGRQLRRKLIRMFAEGSTFPIQPKGKLADVTPDRFQDHRIYRSGISMSLPIKIKSE